MKQIFINKQPKSTNKKWLNALVPAFAFGAFAIVLWREPISTPIIFTGAAVPASVTVLPISSTFVVGADSAAKPLILRGRLTVFNPKIIAAPTGGMVARLLVQPGQIVKAGDTIAMISNQAVPAVEKSRIALQQHAESAQVAATRQQNILQAKLAQEKVLLKAAHERVDKAAQQLAASRDLLRRLQNGEKIPKTETNNQDAKNATTKPSNPSPRKEVATSTATLEQAQQEADRTAKIAAQKWQALHVLLMQQQAAKTAPANSNSTQPPVPTQDQIDAARVDAKNAQDAADKARINAFKLSTAISSASQNKAKPVASTSAPKSTFITEADATRIANAALQESRDALAQVDAIQKQIRRYQSPVQSTTANYQAATSNLEKTQRALFDNPPKVPMTPVIASSGGMVQTLATLAMQVDPGEEIASIVAPNLLSLMVRDSSGFWKNLKVNATFQVNVQTAADGKNLVSTDARLISITPPTRPGQPSILHIQVFNPVAQTAQPRPEPTNNATVSMKPAARARVFSPGMIAFCSIPTNKELTIPRSALRVNSNKQYEVAVLKPEVAPSQKYFIQWNNVVIKNNEGRSANVVISSGLEPGDRIAMQPEMVYNISIARGSLATVQISQK
jgi:multidrug efflux pump subunit AcrA (membrane-fusion protein)